MGNAGGKYMILTLPGTESSSQNVRADQSPRKEGQIRRGALVEDQRREFGRVLHERVLDEAVSDRILRRKKTIWRQSEREQVFSDPMQLVLAKEDTAARRQLWDFLTSILVYGAYAATRGRCVTNKRSGT
jgi:hypothetical protein